jgi:hypothetical protein
VDKAKPVSEYIYKKSLQNLSPVMNIWHLQLKRSTSPGYGRRTLKTRPSHNFETVEAKFSLPCSLFGTSRFYNPHEPSYNSPFTRFDFHPFSVALVASSSFLRAGVRSAWCSQRPG